MRLGQGPSLQTNRGSSRTQTCKMTYPGRESLGTGNGACEREDQMGEVGTQVLHSRGGRVRPCPQTIYRRKSSNDEGPPEGNWINELEGRCSGKTVGFGVGADLVADPLWVLSKSLPYWADFPYTPTQTLLVFKGSRGGTVSFSSWVPCTSTPKPGPCGQIAWSPSIRMGCDNTLSARN